MNEETDYAACIRVTCHTKKTAWRSFLYLSIIYHQLFIIVNRFQCHRQIVIHTFAQDELAHIQHAGAEA